MTIGAVVFPTWQAVLLILLCFGSLGVALYCLFFMVPLKSFVHHVDTLGGGMEGMRAYVDGVRTEVDEKIRQVQESMEEQIQTNLRELRDKMESVSATARKAEAGLRQLDRTVQNLQADLRDNENDVRKSLGQLASLRSEMTDLASDLEAMEGEVEGTLDQMVADSYRRVESTVLSALEAIQDEMVPPPSSSSRGSNHSFFRGGKSRGKPGNGSGNRSRDEDKIISAEPLFGEMPSESENESGGEQVHEPEEQGTPG